MYASVLAVSSHASAVDRPASPEPFRLIRASAGNTVRLIPVTEVICPAGIELLQIEQSVMLDAARMVSATRDESGHYKLTLRGLEETVKVSRACSHLSRKL